MYVQPSTIRYRSDELAELCGPVETQYALPDCTSCDVEVSAVATQFDVSIDVGACVNFTQADLVFNYGNGRTDLLTVPRSVGAISGSTWTFSLFSDDGPPTTVYDPYGYEFDSGTWSMSCTLSDANETASPCTAVFDVPRELQ